MARESMRSFNNRFLWLLFIYLYALMGRGLNAMPDDVYLQQRLKMVETQIRARGIKDPRVLAAMERVPRHEFVPKAYRERAYEDTPLPIGYDQTISQPYIVAYMTAALELKGGEKVLEIGTGSGYQAAILAELGAEVFTFEIVKPLAKEAERRLERLGYRKRIHVRWGDGYKGWPEQAPFDAIIVTAAPPKIPEKLVRELKKGGRMIVPVGSFFQELVLITKEEGKVEKKKLLPVRFVPMVKGKMNSN